MDRADLIISHIEGILDDVQRDAVMSLNSAKKKATNDLTSKGMQKVSNQQIVQKAEGYLDAVKCLATIISDRLEALR